MSWTQYWTQLRCQSGAKDSFRDSANDGRGAGVAARSLNSPILISNIARVVISRRTVACRLFATSNQNLLPIPYKVQIRSFGVPTRDLIFGLRKGGLPMMENSRISLATAALFTFGPAVIATPGATQVGGVTIPQGSFAGAASGDLGAGSGLISDPTFSFNPASSVSAPQLPSQASSKASGVRAGSFGTTDVNPSLTTGALPGGGVGGFDQESGGAGVLGGQ